MTKTKQSLLYRAKTLFFLCGQNEQLLHVFLIILKSDYWLHHVCPSVRVCVDIEQLGSHLMTARISILLKSHASLTCFRACFLPGWAKKLSAPVTFLKHTFCLPLKPYLFFGGGGLIIYNIYSVIILSSLNKSFY